MSTRTRARHALLALAAAVAAAPLEAAGSGPPERPLPLQLLGREGMNSMSLRLDPERLAALHGLERLRMAQVELPDGRIVDFDLERMKVSGRAGEFVVDGESSALRVDDDVMLFHGRVAGIEGSSVFLAFSPFGSRGLIKTGDRRIHLMPDRDAAEGGWDRATLAMDYPFEDQAIPGFDCATAEPAPDDVPSESESGGEGGTSALAGPVYELEIALTSDHQYFQKFGDADVARVFAVTLIGAVSAQLTSQMSVRLVIPYLEVFTTANDPWTEHENGGDVDGELLSQFANAWKGAPKSKHLSHLLSGAGVFGGLAQVGGFCADHRGFALSNMHGTFTAPASQSKDPWDFLVVAHEIGHNLGSPHTHDYSPPIDKCGKAGEEKECIPTGTIMSYCHGCPGGLSNIQLQYHTKVVDKIKAHALGASCTQQPTLAQHDAYAYSVAGGTSIEVGEDTLVGGQIKNVGSATSTTHFAYKVMLSQNATISEFDHEVGAGVSTTGLSTAPYLLKTEVPDDIPPGTYYWGLLIPPVPGETTVFNNQVAGHQVDVKWPDSKKPDLYATGFWAPTSAQPGEPIDLSFEVKNAGAPLTTPVTYRLVLSQNTTITAADILLMQGLTSGDESITHYVTVPPGLSGTYHVGVVLDAAIGESEVANNNALGPALPIGGGTFDAKFVPGQSLIGDLPNGADVDTARFWALQGSKLRLVAASLAPGLSLKVTLVAPNGFSAESTLVAGQTLEQTVATGGAPGALMELRIRAANGTGAYTVKTSVQTWMVDGAASFKTKLSGKGGAVQDVTFVAVSGTDLALSAKAKKVSGALGFQVLGPNGQAISTPTKWKKGGKKGFSAGPVELDEAGEFTLRVTGIQGGKAKVKVGVQLEPPTEKGVVIVD